jgi:hypothetical protein
MQWPKTADVIEEMPADPVGKWQRRPLRDPYGERRDRAI